MHYLLRKKPYRIMWGGLYLVIDDNLADYSKTEDLIGVSTFLNEEDFARNCKDLKTKSYYDKVLFINENSKRWNRIKVGDEAKEFFDWSNTRCVDYSGFLINHTKKQAVDLANYYEQSICMYSDGMLMAIDPVPVLTETGGGTIMALFEGVSCDSTEELAGEWCGDLLEIVDQLPADHTVINCCFANVKGKTRYCYSTFGVDGDDFLLNDKTGKRFEAARLNIRSKRGGSSYFKMILEEDSIIYQPEPVEKIEP